jgi:hypothetical protein
MDDPEGSGLVVARETLISMLLDGATLRTDRSCA